MGPERVAPDSVGLPSRRARREAELASGDRRRPVKVDLARWIPRIAVLCALTGITVVIPLTAGVSPGNGSFVAGAQASEAHLPGTVEAMTGSRVGTLPPPAFASTDATVTRANVAAGRSDEREPLPGCDGKTRAPGANGQLKVSDLCTLWDGVHQLRGDAASSLAELNLSFRARFGRDLCVTDAYRTLARQRTLKAIKGGLAAVPGRSNHGWGLAIDLCSNETSGLSWTWLKENGVVFGWANPVWALSGGSGPHEPWHWEYTRGVIEDGDSYTS